ncbi:MAG: hypothetical protein KUG77_07580, partial [Nannocystaceae bacterium]|nr:hypothetical protein [Nannocystaceae bacterium]
LEHALDEHALVPGEDSSLRARTARAHARAQQAAWGTAFRAEAAGLLAPGDEGPHASRATGLLAAMDGSTADDDNDDAWARGLAAGRTLELDALRGAVAELNTEGLRPAGATRTLAALQFSLGDVAAARSTLDALGTPAAAADLAFYQAWVRPTSEPSAGEQTVPGRAALIQAFAAVRQIDHEQAAFALADARAQLLPWDAVAVTTALRLSFVAADAKGLRAWSEDDSRPWSSEVRELAAAYADVLSGQADRAEARLQSFDADAPWVAYLLGFVAAEQGRWSDGMRHSAVARRGMTGRVELEVLAAWVASHVLDAEVAHSRLVALVEASRWAPRGWTALAQASEAVRAPEAAVLGLYERALEVEHRPAGAAAALAARASGDEALHLWMMASELEPNAARYGAALGMAQVRQGRLNEAWGNAASLQDGDAQAWLTLVKLGLSRVGPEVALDPRVDRWIEYAQQAGAKPGAVEVARLQVAFARGVEVSKQARALSRLHPGRADAAALSIRSLGRAGRLLAARRDAALARRRLAKSDTPAVTFALAAVLRERGELREGAQLAFKGWSGLSAQAGPIEALGFATVAVDIWLELGNSSGAQAIARELTHRMPASPDAWLLRARVQVAAGAPTSACRSLGRAQALDPDVTLVGSPCEEDPA